jgi:hypothetical protein
LYFNNYNCHNSGRYPSSCLLGGGAYFTTDLKLDSILQACPYLKGNTLRLRYELNRLMLSIALRRWNININFTILDIIYRPILYLKYNVSETGLCLCFQVEPTQLAQ